MADIYSSVYRRQAPHTGAYQAYRVWVPKSGANVRWHFYMGELPAGPGDLREDWQAGQDHYGNQGEWWATKDPRVFTIEGFERAGTIYSLDIYNESNDRHRAFRLHAWYSSNGVSAAGEYSEVKPGFRVRHQVLLRNGIFGVSYEFWARKHYASSPGLWERIEPDGGLVTIYQPRPEHAWMETRKQWDVHSADFLAPMNPDVSHFETLFIVTYSGVGGE